MFATDNELQANGEAYLISLQIFMVMVAAFKIPIL